MTKTLALLLDSYRELNAKRLFWIVLILSGLVVVVFAAVGIKGDTITFLWFNTPIKSDMLSFIDAAKLYKVMFTAFGVDFWLSWIATVLALISTAGIFPDFMAGGSIDLYLSKPIGRLRLFLTKYIGGMLFVTLQVGIFSFCCFILLGTRGHSWEPKIFLSIPLVVAVFSYLFCMCVLLGVMTRSTVASVLLTLLLWFGLWGVQKAEGVLLTFSIMQDARAASLDRQIQQTQHELDHYSTTRPATKASNTTDPSFRRWLPFGMFSGRDSRMELKSHLDELRQQRQEITGGLKTAHKIMFVALTVLPKTEATGDLLTRALIDDKADEQNDEPPPDFSQNRQPGPEGRAQQRYLATELKKAYDARTATWILSTSFCFEGVIVILAAWLFCRRDY